MYYQTNIGFDSQILYFQNILTGDEIHKATWVHSKHFFTKNLHEREREREEALIMLFH